MRVTRALPMTSQRWKQVTRLFTNALALPAEERAAFLAAECGSDDAVRAEVEALLAAHHEAETLQRFEEPAITQTQREELLDPPMKGRRIGAYRIVRELGRGGMGAVYLAERVDEQFLQQVAIKIIHRDVEFGDLQHRFQQERQILAQLNHPNIARLLDGGVSQDGRPYIVMEYVDGTPITEYCDAHGLSVMGRLELFQTVCDAVHDAHQNLVVHRDLKPSNILVSEKGRVKLLDFGIAKLLDQRGREKAVARTQTHQYLLTPEYAAPEQVRGEAITTATDLYALGVNLYELLTGRRPYRLKGCSPATIEQIVCEEEPPRPSAIVLQSEQRKEAEEQYHPETTSQQRGTHPAALARQLQGDLDTIILKALHKEPPRRYRSAEQLADDLRRYREGRPVTAQPDTLAYRVRRFVHRHRSAVSAAALTVLLLLGAGGVTAWQAHVAQRQRAQAEERLAAVRQLAGSLIFEVHDAIADLTGATVARALVVERALDYLDRLAEDANADRALRLELAEAYRKVGDVQGNPTNANHGRMQDALVSYGKGLGQAQLVLQDAPADVEARAAVANIRDAMGDVQAAMHDLDAAVESKQQAVQAYRRLMREHPTDTKRQVDYAVARIKLGDVLGNPNFSNTERPRAALNEYEQAQHILARLYAADSSATNVMRLYGLIHERIGTIHDVEERQAAALRAYRRSSAIREQYATAHPANTDAVRDWAVAHEKIGLMHVQMGNLDRAQAQLRQSLDLFRTLSEADSHNAQAKQSLAISHMHMGNLLAHPTRPSFGDPSAATTHFQAARNLLEIVCKIDSTNAHAKSILVDVQERLSELATETSSATSPTL